MQERATGLILRTRPLTETSLIVNWLTIDAGRLSTVAKGARRPKSPFRGKLDLFFVAEFTYTRARRSELHTLKEVRLLHTHEALRRDIDRLQQAAYAVALVEQATERETPIPEVHALITDFLSALASNEWRAESVFWFELKLLNELGLGPDTRSAGVSKRTRDLMATVPASSWERLFQLRPDPGEVKELTHYLHGFLVHHLDRLPQGRAVALKGCN